MIALHTTTNENMTLLAKPASSVELAKIINILNQKLMEWTEPSHKKSGEISADNETLGSAESTTSLKKDELEENFSAHMAVNKKHLKLFYDNTSDKKLKAIAQGLEKDLSLEDDSLARKLRHTVGHTDRADHVTEAITNTAHIFANHLEKAFVSTKNSTDRFKGMELIVIIMILTLENLDLQKKCVEYYTQQSQQQNKVLQDVNGLLNIVSQFSAIYNKVINAGKADATNGATAPTDIDWGAAPVPNVPFVDTANKLSMPAPLNFNDYSRQLPGSMINQIIVGYINRPEVSSKYPELFNKISTINVGPDPLLNIFNILSSDKDKYTNFFNDLEKYSKDEGSDFNIAFSDKNGEGFITAAIKYGENIPTDYHPMPDKLNVDDFKDNNSGTLDHTPWSSIVDFLSSDKIKNDYPELQNFDTNSPKNKGVNFLDAILDAFSGDKNKFNNFFNAFKAAKNGEIYFNKDHQGFIDAAIQYAKQRSDYYNSLHVLSDTGVIYVKVSGSIPELLKNTPGVLKKADGCYFISPAGFENYLKAVSRRVASCCSDSCESVDGDVYTNSANNKISNSLTTTQVSKNLSQNIDMISSQSGQGAQKVSNCQSAYQSLLDMFKSILQMLTAIIQSFR